MAHYNLTTPLSEDDVRQLKVRDTVIVNGHIFGIRDATQIRMFDHHQAPPVDLKGAICIHTAPSLRKVRDKWEKISIGTTTSTRMERFTPPLIEKYGVRAVVGKAGLLEGSLEAMKTFGACYLAIVGGAAALETTQIEEVEEVYWEDLHPEAIYKFRVKDFGPLIVAMDSHGNHLYFDVKKQITQKLPELYKRLGVE
ncbi:MAG: fumarate hydratase C-terminal domain-containing protein [Deltaproteobacteria bacterium]|nr:MAG: fumarate hydratase C-terminal domain-containing protein [Deltaproteobacteria bacterium]